MHVKNNGLYFNSVQFVSVRDDAEMLLLERPLVYTRL